MGDSVRKITRGQVYWFDPVWYNEDGVYQKPDMANTAHSHLLQKSRPYIVVSGDKWNNKLNTCLAVPLTTAGKTNYNGKLVITELGRCSVVITEQIRCIDQGCLGTLYGTVSDYTLKKIMEELAEMCNIPYFDDSDANMIDYLEQRIDLLVEDRIRKMKIQQAETVNEKFNKYALGLIERIDSNFQAISPGISSNSKTKEVQSQVVTAEPLNIDRLIKAVDPSDLIGTDEQKVLAKPWGTIFTSHLPYCVPTVIGNCAYFVSSEALYLLKQNEDILGNITSEVNENINDDTEPNITETIVNDYIPNKDIEVIHEPGRKWTDDQKHLFITEYEEDEISKGDLAKRYGITPISVRVTYNKWKRELNKVEVNN